HGKEFFNCSGFGFDFFLDSQTGHLFQKIQLDLVYLFLSANAMISFRKKRIIRSTCRFSWLFTRLRSFSSSKGKGSWRSLYTNGRQIRLILRS
ncbi:MAG: hypothetical protein IJL15_00915, partial [Clostridia bacterium]|nr:hypothetical protein [Clostridia bacterium]